MNGKDEFDYSSLIPDAESRLPLDQLGILERRIPQVIDEIEKYNLQGQWNGLIEDYKTLLNDVLNASTLIMNRSELPEGLEVQTLIDRHFVLRKRFWDPNRYPPTLFGRPI